MPTLIVIAGANGSGKTTLTRIYQKNFPRLFKHYELINADEIMMHQYPESPILAGKTALIRRKKMLDEGKSFIIETTLSGNSERTLMEKAHERGYKLVLVYVGIEDKALNTLRVKDRVALGGHDVANDDIFRRRVRSFEQVRKVLPLVNRFILFDNTKLAPVKLLHTRKGKVIYHVNKLPMWVKEVLPNVFEKFQRQLGA